MCVVRIGRVSVLRSACLHQPTLSVIMQGSPGCEYWPCFWTWITLLSAWKPAPWHRLSGMQALSPPEPPRVPRKAQGSFPCSQGSLNRADLKMNQEVSASQPHCTGATFIQAPTPCCLSQLSCLLEPWGEGLLQA